MAKKVIKKKKLKILPFLTFIIVIAIIVFSCLLVLNSKVRNIIITGNEILSDDDIISLAGLTNYPSFYKTLDITISKKIKQNKIINKVTITREFYHTIVIKVKENQILYKQESTGKFTLDNYAKVTIDKETPYLVPRLINDIPNNKIKIFNKYFKRINLSVREKISEIRYEPNPYDKDRFLLYMDDGNSVYLTITKFERLNYYNDVLSQLEGKKGILYLDSGNHFQVME